MVEQIDIDVNKTVDAELAKRGLVSIGEATPVDMPPESPVAAVNLDTDEGRSPGQAIKDGVNTFVDSLLKKENK